jgi:hypothetical protein
MTNDRSRSSSPGAWRGAACYLTLWAVPCFSHEHAGGLATVKSGSPPGAADHAQSVICHLSFVIPSLGEAVSAKQRGFGLGDNALMVQEIVSDDVMNLLDFVEQTIGQRDELIGLQYPAWAFFGFEEK